MVDDVDIVVLVIEGIVIDCCGIKVWLDVYGLCGVKGEMLILKCFELQFQWFICLFYLCILLYIVFCGDGVFMLGVI